MSSVKHYIDTRMQDAIELQRASRLLYAQARIKYIFFEDYPLMRYQVIELQEAANVAARMSRERADMAQAIYHLVTGH
jgi:hypothetical protein